MLITIIVAIVLVLMLVFFMKEKQKAEVEEEEELIFDDSDVIKLKVLYKGREVRENEIITTDESISEFLVEGYNLEDVKKVLEPIKMVWECSCPVVKFETPTGLVNKISCRTKGDYIRGITVKYKNRLVFRWKMKFI